MRDRHSFVCFAALTAILWYPTWLVRAQETPEDPGPGVIETGPPTARISVVEGTTLRWSPYDEAKRELVLNDIVDVGDELYASAGSRVEVEFPGDTFLRMDAGSSVVVVSYRDDVEVIATSGTLYISTGEYARVTARVGPDDVVVVSRSMARLEIGSDGIESVAMALGRTRVHAGRTFEVIEFERVWPVAEGDAWGNEPFDPFEGDDFDLWNLERELIVRPPLDLDVPSYPLVGFFELADYGEWIVVDGMWAWHPFVDPQWRPFSTGEWIWYEPYGWVWVDAMPWGWVVSHHGRWIFSPEYGWVWIPGMVWAPAWVRWGMFGPHIGWCPCDWWGYAYVPAGWHSYYWYDCWIFAGHEYFYGGGYHPGGPDGGGGHGDRRKPPNSHPRRPGDKHEPGTEGASPSHDRDELRDLDDHRIPAPGSWFVLLDEVEFDILRPTPVAHPGRDLIRAEQLSPLEQLAFEEGGEVRQALLDDHYQERAETNAAAAVRLSVPVDQGADEESDGDGGSSSVTIVAGGGGDVWWWPAMPVAGVGVPAAAADDLRVGSPSVAGESRGGDETPHVPRYSGRTDGVKSYDIESSSGSRVLYGDAVRGADSGSTSRSSSSPTWFEPDRSSGSSSRASTDSPSRSSSGSKASSDSSSSRSSGSKSSSSRSSSSRSSSSSKSSGSKSSSSKSSSSKSSSSKSSGKSSKK